MKYAQIINGIVENIINWDGEAELNLDGDLVLADDSAWIGAKYDGSTFEVKPIPPDTRTYAEKRQPEYPDVGDQLDAILKYVNLQRMAGNDLPEDLDQILTQWLSVKQKYPKG